MGDPIRVTVWNEFKHEKHNQSIADIYPDGIHGAIADGLRKIGGVEVGVATLDQPEQGLTQSTLDGTDVLIWWSHAAHNEVQDGIVDRVYARVMDGMGIILLHSTQGAKIFTKLLGTTGTLKWRESGEKERLWVVAPGHPIAEGLNEYFEIEETEMYGEFFDIPTPDTLVFISWFPGGEVFRSGCCFYRGKGKIFYFRPGHETHPIFFNENVRKVLGNAVKWAKPGKLPNITLRNVNVQPLEEI